MHVQTKCEHTHTHTETETETETERETERVKGTNLAVDKLTRIFEVSATLSHLKTTKIKATRPHATEKWFDNDCKRLRKEVRILSNQKLRDADNENICHLDHEKLKQYRNIF